jgi:hypothetical protein
MKVVSPVLCLPNPRTPKMLKPLGDYGNSRFQVSRLETVPGPQPPGPRTAELPKR